MHQGIYEELMDQEDAIPSIGMRFWRWGTVLTGALVLILGVSLYFFPELNTQEVYALDHQIESEEAADNRETVPVYVPAAVVEDDREDEDADRAQLRVELPSGVLEAQLWIENDYLTQTVYVRFPNGVDDYFSEYRIRGSSDHIAYLDYIADGSDGVIVLGLDAVYELEEFCEDGILYLNFADPHERCEKVIVVDAGHGGKVPGAVRNKVLEKDINLSILLELKQLLDEDDRFCVYYTRTTDVNPTLSQRVQLANRSGADLFLSIHNNASASGSSRRNGTLVLYSESDKSEFSSKRLAQICSDAVTEVLGSGNRGLLAGDNIYIIRTSEAPVALIEVGYMTNREELDKLQTTEYQKKAAEGIYQAIQRAFEEGY